MLYGIRLIYDLSISFYLFSTFNTIFAAGICPLCDYPNNAEGEKCKFSGWRWDYKLTIIQGGGGKIKSYLYFLFSIFFVIKGKRI